MPDKTHLTNNLEYVCELVQAQSSTDLARPQVSTEAQAKAELIERLSAHRLDDLVAHDLVARRRVNKIAIVGCLIASAAIAILRIVAPLLPKPVTTYPAPLNAATGQATVVLGALALGLFGAAISLLIAPQLADAKLDRIDYRWGAYPRLVAGATLALVIGLLFFQETLVTFIYASTSDIAAQSIAVGTTIGAGFATRYVLGLLLPLIKIPGA